MVVSGIIGRNPPIRYRKPSKENHSDCWITEICAIDEVKKVTESILPYLVAKKQQAELVLYWVKIKKNTLEINDRLYNEQLSVRDKIKSLNTGIVRVKDPELLDLKYQMEMISHG